MNSSIPELSQRLDFAVEAARRAGELILSFYQRDDLHVDLKSDESPVTAADRGAEELIRQLVGETFPDDGVLGEEFEDKPAANGFRWILDPVDGTKSFVHGVPLFGTLIGVEHDGQMVAGVCRFPALNEVVYAATGQGTWWQTGGNEPRRAKVTDVAQLADALFCTTTITGWDTTGNRAAFDRLCDASRLVRGWSDCYGHILVATGRADVMVDPEMNAWDIAALIPIVQEAGGEFVDWAGNTTIDGGNGLSVNSMLKDEVLSLLKK
ncbi:MAG: histidinol-phosphatase [Planctomycetaceae bacterium]|jgi:histidinol-phosphatase|nr:histidinol-phosphatase [Planctomycetaceae bacterium]MBT6157031.1 histidinol-phosphatase [Planctomycetaceae bacterium]MBT6484403.1 histidinol-phosphatase [Planctomycetaceae bacterium]MBT6497996.1 histidinol-phosphatase [Planctomycetaceae bacterium]